jgi:NitT/TauT family transport system ATP-binding protein
MTDAGTLIEVDHLFKTYPVAEKGDRLVLDDLNFRLAPGEIVAVLGKSGSGKSTFLRIIAGLSEGGDGVPKLRALPLADGSGECRARS